MDLLNTHANITILELIRLSPPRLLGQSFSYRQKSGRCRQRLIIYHLLLYPPSYPLATVSSKEDRILCFYNPYCLLIILPLQPYFICLYCAPLSSDCLPLSSVATLFIARVFLLLRCCCKRLLITALILQESSYY